MSSLPMRKTLTISLFIAALMLVSVSVQADTVNVDIVSFSFSPDTITIDAGTTVRWTNQDVALHTSTSDGGVWDSGSLSQGQSFSFTFNTIGDFTYHCEFHPTTMKDALVRVVASPVPSMTPYGMTILAVLLLLTAIWVYRRKRVSA